MNNLIISAIGSDRPGIVSDLTGIITSHGGNIEESRMTRLGVDFAIIMLVSVDSNWLESLEVSIQSIDELSIITKPTKILEKIKKGLKKCEINLSGADNEGIVQVLSKYLAEKSINILDMETYISNAPITGTPLFNLKAITETTKKIKIPEIQSDLSQIESELGVEIVASELK